MYPASFAKFNPELGKNVIWSTGHGKLGELGRRFSQPVFVPITSLSWKFKGIEHKADDTAHIDYKNSTYLKISAHFFDYIGYSFLSMRIKPTISVGKHPIKSASLAIESHSKMIDYSTYSVLDKYGHQPCYLSKTCKNFLTITESKKNMFKGNFSFSVATEPNFECSKDDCEYIPTSPTYTVTGTFVAPIPE